MTIEYELHVLEPAEYLAEDRWVLDTAELQIGTHLNGGGSPSPESGYSRYIRQDWSRIVFGQILNDAWYHQITIELAFDDSDRLAFYTDNFPVDALIEIYRVNSELDRRDLVYVGINQTIVDQIKADGTFLINLYGQGMLSIIKRHLHIAASDLTRYEGSAETVIKHMIDDNIIAPSDDERRSPQFVREADQGRGDSTEYTRSHVNLYTAISNVAEQGNIDFGVNRETYYKYVLDAKPIWGLDKSRGNPDFNSVVVFSVEMSNMHIPIRSINRSDEKNIIYMGGAGNAESRLITTVEDSTAIAESIWNRKEYYKTNSELNNIPALVDEASAILAEKKRIKNITFNVIDSGPFRWLQDWELGDIVTVEYFDSVFEQQIAKIVVNVSKGNAGNLEDVTVEFIDGSDKGG